MVLAWGEIYLAWDMVCGHGYGLRREREQLGHGVNDLRRMPELSSKLGNITSPFSSFLSSSPHG